MKKYLFFVSLPYAYSILRPLEREIWRQGNQVMWFFEEGCPIALEAEETQLKTIQEVMEYNPIAVFAPGNYIPYFFPGIKVELFHGYPINKRNDRSDDHFTLRGWFDIYCTQGPSSTEQFEKLARKKGYFRVYETGWTKADTYFSESMQLHAENIRPTILYSTTFTRSLTSTPYLAEEIERLVSTGEWDWFFMFHPKLDDSEVLARYQQIAARYPNATYVGNTFDAEVMRQADVMLCDSSSIILEFMFLDKPVVTFRNSNPRPSLIDIQQPSDLAAALNRAIARPDELMNEIRRYTLQHEAHRDCCCSFRVLAAVDDFLARGRTGLRRKPLNLVRKFKVRRQFGYWKR